MTQDEKWQENCQRLKDYIEINKRNPSRHRIEDHLLLNWIRHNRKLMNSGKMKAYRIDRFKELLTLIEKYKRINQYE